MKIIAMGAMLAIGLSAPALGRTDGAGLSNDPAAADTLSKPLAKKDTSRRVCRMLTPTGSRLPLRSCRTQAEWDAEAARYQKDADAQRRNDETVRPGTSTNN